MNIPLKPLKIKYNGQHYTIDLNKELSINENLLGSQLRDSPSSYYLLCTIRDKHIKDRDSLAREQEYAYSQLWTYYKDSNERWNNDYVDNKVKQSKKYSSICDRYIKAQEKANQFISLCRAYESRENILRTISANLRKQQD